MRLPQFAGYVVPIDLQSYSIQSFINSSNHDIPFIHFQSSHSEKAIDVCPDRESSIDDEIINEVECIFEDKRQKIVSSDSSPISTHPILADISILSNTLEKEEQDQHVFLKVLVPSANELIQYLQTQSLLPSNISLQSIQESQLTYAAKYG